MRNLRGYGSLTPFFSINKAGCADLALSVHLLNSSFPY